MSIAFEKDFKPAAGYAAADASAQWWDRTGLITSLGCIVHCLATPIAMIVLPSTLGGWFASPLVHQFLAIAVIVAAAGSLAPGYWRHRQNAVLVPALLGMAVLLYAAFWVPCCGSESGSWLQGSGLPWSSQLSIVGGFCLIAAHWNNLRATVRRRCACH